MRRTTASAAHHCASIRALARATAMLMVLFAGCGGEAGTAAADDASAAASEPIVDTTYGKVRGAIADGIYTFKGIPYGASTAGAGRFKLPARPAAWEGVRDALVYGNRAPQATLTQESAGDYGKLIRWYEQPGEMSEDCLVLNVWTPGIGNGSKRPVMVWFHGGGFASGTGNSAGLRRRSLARFGDVVVVTVNHRLGVLGYLYLGDLAGPEYAESGSAGTLDLVAALEWVRDNIAASEAIPATSWSGAVGRRRQDLDPARDASAKGLFHRAAVQSGSSLHDALPRRGHRRRRSSCSRSSASTSPAWRARHRSRPRT